ncbi:methyl-accepting chemotaxis protein [Archangium sp.]|uniref:methyl-accepting chemotaxis protein n=1 Tax=Archangium sp. TaxID=1872627 RepID=UPI00389AF841
MRPLSPEAEDIFKRLFKTIQNYSTLGTPVLVYLLVLICGLDASQGKTVALWVVPVLIPLTGVILPRMVIKYLVGRAIDAGPEVPPEQRLQWLLQLPSQLALFMFMTSVVGGVSFASVSVLLYSKSPWIIPWAVTGLGLSMLMVVILERLAFEDILRPFAVAFFHQAPDRMPKGRGISWARQSWMLPTAFAIFVLSTLVTTLTILGRQGYEAFISLRTQLVSITSGEQAAQLLSETVGKMAGSLLLPVTLVGTYVLSIAAYTAWRMARHQTEGARSIAQSLEGLAQGKPSLPKWVSTDEIGDLAAATAGVFEQLRSFSLSLKDSALSLQDSAKQLGSSTFKQTEMLSIQASALQETQVTAQEIKTTSLVASQKAGTILTQAERADEISRTGELALQQGLAGIEEIGSQVREMAMSIKSLDERARQVARITSIVKDLADQSNMLALNAAIEAVRSGESGLGFGVVAKEIRSLADQSIRATANIRSILQDISNAIATANSLTLKGSQRVEASLRQIREFSDQAQQVSAIVRDNASSVRQITAAVTQQDAGIAQITQAVQQLTTVMEQTMAQMHASNEAISVVRNVAEQVSDVVTSYGWSQKAESQAASVPNTPRVTG